MIAQKWFAALSLFAAAALAGCASNEPGRSIDDPTNSLVFGYVDMADAPTSVDVVRLRQVAPPPPDDRAFWRMGVRDGMFYNSYLPSGSYILASLYGSSWWRGEYQYNFPRQQGGGDTAVRADKPGIYFLGSFKYKSVKTGFLEAAKFDIERVNSPTEAELLQRMLDKDQELAKSTWGDKIRQRLARLKK
jgi:hypothetical protein